jgi:hypothetical protein
VRAEAGESAEMGASRVGKQETAGGRCRRGRAIAQICNKYDQSIISQSG